MAKTCGENLACDHCYLGHCLLDLGLGSKHSCLSGLDVHRHLSHPVWLRLGRHQHVCHNIHGSWRYEHGNRYRNVLCSAVFSLDVGDCRPAATVSHRNDLSVRPWNSVCQSCLLVTAYMAVVLTHETGPSSAPSFASPR